MRRTTRNVTEVEAQALGGLLAAANEQHQRYSVAPGGHLLFLPPAAHRHDWRGGWPRLGCRRRAVDKAGNVYVADTAGHIARKVTPTGEVTTIAGAPDFNDSNNGKY